MNELMNATFLMNKRIKLLYMSLINTLKKKVVKLLFMQKDGLGLKLGSVVCPRPSIHENTTDTRRHNKIIVGLHLLKELQSWLQRSCIL